MTTRTEINLDGIASDELHTAAVYAIAGNKVIEHRGSEITAYEIELARTADRRGRLYVLVGGDEAPVFKVAGGGTEKAISEAKAIEVLAKIG